MGFLYPNKRYSDYAYPVVHYGKNYGYQTRLNAKKHVGYRSDGNCPIIGYPAQGTHNDANGGWASKNGIDFKGDPWTSDKGQNCTWVVAVTTGKISTGSYGPRLSSYDNGSAGYQLYLKGNDGSLWFYTHIIIANGIKADSQVSKGQKIGYVFNYTNNTSHLHIAKKSLDPNDTFLLFPK